MVSAAARKTRHDASTSLMQIVYRPMSGYLVWKQGQAPPSLLCSIRAKLDDADHAMMGWQATGFAPAMWLQPWGWGPRTLCARGRCRWSARCSAGRPRPRYTQEPGCSGSMAASPTSTPAATCPPSPAARLQHDQNTDFFMSCPTLTEACEPQTLPHCRVSCWSSSFTQTQ